MTHGLFHPPTPQNEPVQGYAPGSPERGRIEAELKRQAAETVEVPLIVGGKEIRTGNTAEMVMPHDHGHVLGTYHKAGADEVRQAADAATAARHDWEQLPWEERAAVFLRAAELLATTWRDRINASTMLNQSKTVHQAEIDAACELIGLLALQRPLRRAAVRRAARVLAGHVEPPRAPAARRLRLRDHAVQLHLDRRQPADGPGAHGQHQPVEAGLDLGAVELLPDEAVRGGGATGRRRSTSSRAAAPRSATRCSRTRVSAASTSPARPQVFQGIWKSIGENIATYGQYPRLVGETGGKDFVFVHPSAEAQSVTIALVRGAFEYQGQKCSAASRAYVPKSLWGDVKERLAAELSQVRMGDVRDFSNFLGAVIDASSYGKQKAAIEGARNGGDAEIVIGGECDDSTGWFVQPTVIEARNPRYETMCTELFGPVLTVHVYDDNDVDGALELCATGSEYALTGAVFANDRAAVRKATDALRFAAGNFYVNDKPTGAVVGQQPFGGSRASGTNDKAGSILNLLRWVSPRTIKETFVPPTDWRYPFLG